MSFSSLFDAIASEEPYNISDKKSEKELSQFKKENYQEVTLKSLKKRRFNDNTKLRTVLSKWAFILLSVWILFVMTILVLNNYLFCISDNVLIALLSTTTINVIGIVLIVMKDIFNGQSENNMENVE